MPVFRYRERGNIEAQYFNIQARLKANGQKMYQPPEGKLIHDIESAWTTLEKCEHGREVALKDELIRWVQHSAGNAVRDKVCVVCVCVCVCVSVHTCMCTYAHMCNMS